MKIQEISIKNFRGVSTETKIKLNDFNTIVGQNDTGKSTILIKDTNDNGWKISQYQSRTN